MKTCYFTQVKSVINVLTETYYFMQVKGTFKSLQKLLFLQLKNTITVFANSNCLNIFCTKQ